MIITNLEKVINSNLLLQYTSLTFGALGAKSPDGIFRDRTFIAVDVMSRRYIDSR